MKIGLEIHQRLNTKKLFCSCHGESKEEIARINRRLHLVLSEMGKVDISAKKEHLKKNNYTYIVTDNSCLVECDEEPPHDINREALLISLGVARYLNMNIVDEIHTMRKTVIDGSNTSGFQRTAIIGLDGSLDTSKGRVGIQTLCLEEESAGIVGEKGSNIFSLDRLGIPLIEIATAPDIQDGEHARETAKKIGMILRMTGHAARGIGTIRQDLNISIKGGARVEIKGVQELDDIPILVENEVKRQKKLIEIIKKIPKKPAFLKPVDLTDAFLSSKISWISNKVNKKKSKAIGIKLPGLKGITGIELYENHRYGSELSDYAKIYGFGGLIHGDEDSSKYDYNLKTIQEKLNLGENDNFVIIFGNDFEKVENALRDVFDRAYLNIVPSETRRALKDGKSSYMRPMSSGARMYPETDVPKIKVDKELINKSNEYIPKDPEVVFKELKEELNEDLAMQLIKSKYLWLYYELAHIKGINAKIVAITLTNTLKTIQREGISPNNATIIRTLELYKENKITKKAIEEIIRIATKENLEPGDVVNKRDMQKISGAKLKELLEKEGGDRRRLIAKYRLRIEAEELFKI